MSNLISHLLAFMIIFSYIRNNRSDKVTSSMERYDANVDQNNETKLVESSTPNGSDTKRIFKGKHDYDLTPIKVPKKEDVRELESNTKIVVAVLVSILSFGLVVVGTVATVYMKKYDEAAAKKQGQLHESPSPSSGSDTTISYAHSNNIGVETCPTQDVQNEESGSVEDSTDKTLSETIDTINLVEENFDSPKSCSSLAIQLV